MTWFQVVPLQAISKMKVRVILNFLMFWGDWRALRSRHEEFPVLLWLLFRLVNPILIKEQQIIFARLRVKSVFYLALALNGLESLAWRSPREYVLYLVGCNLGICLPLLLKVMKTRFLLLIFDVQRLSSRVEGVLRAAIATEGASIIEILALHIF